MAYFAESTWSGLVVENSYVESQSFDKDTAALKAQAARGWTAATAYDGSQFRLDLRDRDGSPLRDAVVTAHIGRPASAQQDRVLILSALGDGGYGGETVLARGIWEAALSVVAQGESPWTRKIRFTVR